MTKSNFIWSLVIALALIFAAVVIVYIAIINEEGYGLALFTAGICFILGIALFFYAASYLGRGKPRTFLPNGKEFTKIDVIEKNNHTFLWLKRDDWQPEYFKVLSSILLDDRGVKIAIANFPDKFKIAQSRRIKEGEEHKKKPEMKIVYYLLPIEQSS